MCKGSSRQQSSQEKGDSQLTTEDFRYDCNNRDGSDDATCTMAVAGKIDEEALRGRFIDETARYLEQGICRFPSSEGLNIHNHEHARLCLFYTAVLSTLPRAPRSHRLLLSKSDSSMRPITIFRIVKIPRIALEISLTFNYIGRIHIVCLIATVMTNSVVFAMKSGILQNDLRS